MSFTRKVKTKFFLRYVATAFVVQLIALALIFLTGGDGGWFIWEFYLLPYEFVGFNAVDISKMSLKLWPILLIILVIVYSILVGFVVVLFRSYRFAKDFIIAFLIQVSAVILTMTFGMGDLLFNPLLGSIRAPSLDRI
jgi:hypothetical protein